jgi:hypothetical protein
LSNLFDVVIHLNQNEEKTISIEETGYMNAIFIDDSFEERSKVHLEFNIPVFSVDCIKSLLI